MPEARSRDRVADTQLAPVRKLAPGPGRPASKVAASQCARLHRTMFELVAEKGFEQVTVRELVSTAKVSSRAFYEHFDSKEDCFARTHQRIVRRIVRRIDAAQAGERGWQERLRLAVDAFAHELARDPYTGRLALIDVYAMGSDGFRHLRRLERAFAEKIKMGFPSGVSEEDSSLLIEGMVSGIVSVARSRLLAGRGEELPGLADPLADWALSLLGGPTAGSADFIPQIKSRGRLATDFPLAPSSASATAEGGSARAPEGERALFLSAMAKLAAAQGYENLTERGLCEVAGVSRRAFRAGFDGLEDCFLEAVEGRTREVLARAAVAQASAPDWGSGVHRAIASVCADVGSDPVFTSLHFDAVFAVGRPGLECRERLMSDATRRLCGTAPRHARLDELQAEASVGAIWGVLGQCVANGQAGQASHLSQALAHMVLAAALALTRTQSTSSQPSSNR